MINKVILIGNVGADPEIRTLESGVKVANIRLATTERIYNRESQEAREHTEWHNVTLWRNLADVADRFVRKGSQIYIEGRLRSRDWTDQQGNKRYAIDIVADDLKLLGRKQDNAPTQPLSSQGGGYQAPQQGGGQGSQQGGYSVPQQYAPQPTQNTPEPDITMPEDPDDLPF